jgi:hypothetical protein
MRPGWLFRPADRMILHAAGKESVPLPIDTVPRVLGTILHLTDDGETIRIEYLIRGKRQRRSRIVTEDELDRGTWASKVGQNRPNSSEAKQAFATIIRAESNDAEEIPARAYYNEDGDLVLPGPEAQAFGYRVTAGTEEQARDAWDEIAAWATVDPKSALVLGAVFVGPVLDSLDVLAHIVNLVGTGQQGKSTALTAAAALLGDVKPRRQQLLGTWNSSKQGITQGLRARGFLPLALDEHSSSGRTVKEGSREFSQIVAGAIRQMGSADGSPRESDGFWHSVLLSSSNDRLRFQGQSEDLASRLQEIEAPFFPNAWVDAEGAPIAPEAGGAEHLSKRIKRLAKSAGGWPLEWAVRRGLFRAENLRALKKAHLELCAKHCPRTGGIPDTIAELHMAWVVGALMLEKVLDVRGLSAAAEQAAAERLAAAIQDAAEANMPEGEKLWTALDGLRLEASAYPDAEDLPKAAADSFRKVKGFVRPGEWWVLDSVVRQAAAEYGVENLMTALRQLDDAGVHVRGDGKNTQRQLPRALRLPELPKRMHCFNTTRAGELYGGLEESDDPTNGGGPTSGPTWTDHRTDLDRPQVGPLSGPLTCGGPTGPTGPTFLELALNAREEEATARPGGAGVPEPRFPKPVEAVTDPAFADLAARVSGRTRGALRFGVLGADPQAGAALWLPNSEPVPLAALPGGVDDVAVLMGEYRLKTLWVHESAALAMGLPTCEERRAMPALAEGQEQDEHDGQDQEETRPGSVGPQTPVGHPWAVPSGTGRVEKVAPGGLAAWLTLVCPDPDGGKEQRLSVALPLYDTRYDKNHRRGGFGGAETPAVMLDALMVWTVATAHGRPERPEVIPFYASVNRTAQDFAGGRHRDDVLCETVRRGELDAVVDNRVKLMVPQKWDRKPTQAERSMVALHQFDKTAAWLGAFSNIELGIGEPVHATCGAVFDRKVPGFWRVAEVPGRGLPGLPELRFTPAAPGGYWISTPSIVLLLELYPDWTPDVVEAWYWPQHKRALNGMYDKVRTARERIVTAMEAGRPGAVWAKQLIGRTYQSFRGYMARSSGPMTDYATGQDYKQDIYYRPDWARLIMDHATANMYRNLRKFAADGCWPLAVYVDAVTFASHEPDPMAARPASMVTGTAKWTHEGTVPLAQVLPAIDAGTSAHKALDDYLNRGE